MTSAGCLGHGLDLGGAWIMSVIVVGSLFGGSSVFADTSVNVTVTVPQNADPRVAMGAEDVRAALAKKGVRLHTGTERADLEISLLVADGSSGKFPSQPESYAISVSPDGK